MTVYVACKFRPTDTRTYTYQWDREPLFPGDMVKVPDRAGDGWQRVEVVFVTDEAPKFACKSILGKLEPEPDPGAGDVLDTADLETELGK